MSTSNESSGFKTWMYEAQKEIVDLKKIARIAAGTRIKVQVQNASGGIANDERNVGDEDIIFTVLLQRSGKLAKILSRGGD